MPVTIVGYPFGHAADEWRTRYAPAILRDVLESALPASIRWCEPEGIPQDIAEEPFVPGRVKHRAEVLDAVTRLGVELARAAWRGEKPLAVGGDHSQGFATIKAALLVETAKALTGRHATETLAIRSPGAADIRKQLCLLADNGEMLALAEAIDALIERGLVDRLQLRQFLDGIHIIWVDAHADYNTAAISPSGNFHGMALAAAAGFPCDGLETVLGAHLHANPRNITVVAARDLDEAEVAKLRADGVCFDPYDLHRPDETLRTHLPDVIGGLLARPGRFIVSVDIDHIDGSDVPATGTPMGLTEREMPAEYRRLNRFGDSPEGPPAEDAYRAFAHLMQRSNVVAADLTEASTAYGHNGDPVSDGGRTMTVATRLLGAMLGMERTQIDRLLADTNLQTLGDWAMAQERLDSARQRRAEVLAAHS